VLPGTTHLFCSLARCSKDQSFVLSWLSSSFVFNTPRRLTFVCSERDFPDQIKSWSFQRAWGSRLVPSCRREMRGGVEWELVESMFSKLLWWNLQRKWLHVFQKKGTIYVLMLKDSTTYKPTHKQKSKHTPVHPLWCSCHGVWTLSFSFSLYLLERALVLSVNLLKCLPKCFEFPLYWLCFFTLLSFFFTLVFR